MGAPVLEPCGRKLSERIILFWYPNPEYNILKIGSPLGNRHSEASKKLISLAKTPWGKSEDRGLALKNIKVSESSPFFRRDTLFLGNPSGLQGRVLPPFFGGDTLFLGNPFGVAGRVLFLRYTFPSKGGVGRVLAPFFGGDTLFLGNPSGLQEGWTKKRSFIR